MKNHLKPFLIFMITGFICLSAPESSPAAGSRGMESAVLEEALTTGGILMDSACLKNNGIDPDIEASSTQEDTRKICEETILAAIRSFSDEIPVSGYGLTAENISSFLSRLLNGNPDIFYVDSSFRYARNSEEVTRLYLTYTETPESAAKKQAEINACVQEAQSSLSSSMSQIEKALALHDYLVLHTEYLYDQVQKGENIPSSAYNIYGALVQGEAVCQGYTLAYEYLLTQAGIENGVASSDSLSHVWNIVYIDGAWYHTDTAQDDVFTENAPECPGYAGHTFFMRTEKWLLKNQKGREDLTTETYGESSYSSGGALSMSGAFWRKTESQCYYYDGSWYLIGTSDGRIRRTSSDGQNLEILDDTEKTWPHWNSYKTYGISYARLLGCGDTIYFSCAGEIRCFNLKRGKSWIVLRPSLTKGYIYGLSCEDGTLLYTTATSPQSSQTLHRTQIQADGSQTTAKLRSVSSYRLVLSRKTYVYNGKARKPSVKVYDGERLVPKNEYILSWKSNKNAGTAKTVITGNTACGRTGKKKATFTIQKATQKITGVKNIYKKKKSSGSFLLKPKAKTRITYQSSNQRVVKINKNGKVTIVGTGKAKITLKAVGTANYKSVSKVITIQITSG